MGGSLSTASDDAKQISGIMAADYSADHPNYLAIVNVNRFDHDIWDKLMDFMNANDWNPAYENALRCKYYLKRFDGNPTESQEFIDETYAKLGGFQQQLKEKYGKNMEIEFAIVKVCLPSLITRKISIPNMRAIFEQFK